MLAGVDVAHRTKYSATLLEPPYIIVLPSSLMASEDDPSLQYCKAGAMASAKPQEQRL